MAGRAAEAKLIASMRETLELSRSLERFIPLRESLGIVLRKMPWVMASPTIDKEQTRLLQEYEKLGKQLDDGELENAADAWTSLQTELAALAELNVAAAVAEQAREAFKQEEGSVADRVRKLDGYKPIATLADNARQEWEEGKFLDSQKDFGQALQILTATVPQLETPEETSNREAQQTSRLRDAATSLRKQLAATAGERDTQLARVRELEGQITQAAKKNLDDRAALKAALARAEELAGKNKAGSTVLAELRNTIQQQKPLVAELADLKPKHQDVVAERDELKRKLESLQRQVAVSNAAVKSKNAQNATRAAQEEVVEITNRRLPANGIGLGAGERVSLMVKGIDVPFRWCPPGLFMMGSPAKDTDRDTDENQVSVTLTSGFWMMETECTQELWAAVMGSSPEANCGKGAKYPVYNVSHDDCVAFCTKLHSLFSGSSSLPSGWKIQLPTEAQWEYACRAGSTTRYCFGDSDNQLSDYAWYDRNSSSTTHPVGQKQANKWGLRDMHGNVWEWCADWYADELAGGTDPKGPVRARYRVLRGGSWYLARYARSANRDWFTPDYPYFLNGFRVVLAARTP